MKLVGRRLRAREIYSRHKKWRALMLERQELRALIDDAPLVKLEEPYQKGFVRYYELSAKAKERDDYEALNQALGYVRNVQCCRRGDFLVKKKKSKGLRPRGHELTQMSLRHLLMFDIPEELLLYFVFYTGRPVESYQEVRELYREGGRHHLWFRHAVLCERVIKPHMITHQKAVLSDVESRLDFINKVMDRDHVCERLSRYSWNSWARLCDRVYDKSIELDDRQRIAESLQEHYETQQREKGAGQLAPFSFLPISELLQTYRWRLVI